LMAYKSLYLETAKTYFASMMTDVATLLITPTDTKALDDMYISSHSMKGQSAMMEFSSTSVLCHTLERISFLGKEGKLLLSPELVHLMSDAVTHLQKNLDRIETENSEDDFSKESEALQSFAHIILS
ncbi:MAG: hypothetical protein EPO02_14040, partial [Nitrospirae bacterium]